MLEAVILDRVEQTANTVVPVIQSIKTKYPLVADATVASSTAEFIKNYMGLTATSWVGPPPLENLSTRKRPIWLPTTARFFLCGYGNASGLLTMSYDPTTDTFATEDSVRALEAFHEDNTGVVWAISNKVGYYGLWKRTGVGAWTQVLVDTAITCYLGKWTTGTIYHVSSGGNWYSITSGAATLSINPGIAGGYTNFIVMAWYQNLGSYRYSGYMASGPNNGATGPLGESAVSAYSDSASGDSFYIWKWPDKTRVMVKSKTLWDVLSKAPSANPGDICYIPIANSAYWLGLYVRANAVNGDNRLIVAAVLCNFATATEQYLGQWDLTYVYGAAGTGTWQQAATAVAVGLAPMMAYMANGVIQLYYLGQPLSYNFAMHGVVRQDITARILI